MGFMDLLYKKPVAESKEPVVEEKPLKANTPATVTVNFKGPESSGIGVAVLSTNTTDYVAYFKKLLVDVNIPGPDYLEFQQALEGMGTQTLTEQQKYLSIFTGFSTMGVTVDKLVKTANQYVATIDKESTDFEEQYNQTFQNEVTSREASIQAIAQENEQLTQKIQANNTKIGELNTEISQTKISLANEKAAFVQAYQNSKQLIEEQVKKINLYLNGTPTNK